MGLLSNVNLSIMQEMKRWKRKEESRECRSYEGEVQMKGRMEGKWW